MTALGQGLKFETDEPHFITLGGGRLSVGVTMCPVKTGKCVWIWIFATVSIFLLESAFGESRYYSH